MLPVPEETVDATPLPAPILYVTDLAYDRFDPADLFDIAFLLRSPFHELRGVVFGDEVGEGTRALDVLTVRAKKETPVYHGADGLMESLRRSSEPVSVVAVGGYGIVADVLARDRALFREKVARLFLVGGYVNEYTATAKGTLPPRTLTERIPIDPRLRERNPERFTVQGDPRAQGREQKAFGQLLTSGEGVIWLPRDICLWRYAAPGILSDGGPVAEFLLRELFYANLIHSPDTDRYDAADAPALLSSTPAFLLAVRPEPMAWMRHFRAVTARAEIDERGRVTAFATRTDSPNLYCVIAIDGHALGKVITPRLRDRPLNSEI